jgi:beta-glucosidase/6-phospho-beta-glucosidase/beta-galactosidase
MITHRYYGSVTDNTTGDSAAEHYYLYKQDFARLANLGIPYYSFSVSWPRFFPFGAANSPVNEQGVAHYDDFLSSLIEVGVKPVITLFHWDTPLALFNSYGAWTSENIVDDFVNYAKFVITRYDDYVPIWYTFNERESSLHFSNI